MTQDREPLVSIGVPVYNGERFIRKALESLLRQTHTNIELIVSDNGSTDGTSAICREFAARDPRVRYFRNERTVRVVKNICRTFELSSADYFMWTPVDDERAPTVAADLLAALLRNPAAVMAHGPLLLNVEAEGRVVEMKNAMDLSRPCAPDRVRAFTANVQHPAMLFGLFRREAFARAVFRQTMGHDYLLCLQMCLLGPVEYVPSHIITYRHRWAALGSPMPACETISLRDLLFYRGVRRRKSWTSLILGVRYLLNGRGVPVRDRVASGAAFLRTFVGRHKRNLAFEIVFLAFTPISYIAMPFLPTGRRLKLALARR